MHANLESILSFHRMCARVNKKKANGESEIWLALMEMSYQQHHPHIPTKQTWHSAKRLFDVFARIKLLNPFSDRDSAHPLTMTNLSGEFVCLISPSAIVHSRPSLSTSTRVAVSSSHRLTFDRPRHHSRNAFWNVSTAELKFKPKLIAPCSEALIQWCATFFWQAESRKLKLM